MFLKELWRYHKLGFALLVLFLGLMAFLNYKHGAVATPIFQYGMYSGRIYIQDTQKVYQLKVNNQLLNLSKYSFSEIDIIQGSLINYKKQEVNNDAVFLTMKSIMSKIGVGHFMHQSSYSNNITNTAFTLWYKNIVQKIIGYPVYSLEVYEQKYIWQTDSLKPASSPIKQLFIVAN